LYKLTTSFGSSRLPLTTSTPSYLPAILQLTSSLSRPLPPQFFQSGHSPDNITFSNLLNSYVFYGGIGELVVVSDLAHIFCPGSKRIKPVLQGIVWQGRQDLVELAGSFCQLAECAMRRSSLHTSSTVHALLHIAQLLTLYSSHNTFAGRRSAPSGAASDLDYRR
jgi:hypothetical protein